MSKPAEPHAVVAVVARIPSSVWAAELPTDPPGDVLVVRSTDTAAPTPDRRCHFEAQALPHRQELERAAFRYARSFHDAEDLVSETYAKAWASFETFRPGTNIRAWLHRIMTNAWIDAYRRAEKRPLEALTDSFTDARLSAVEKRFATAPSAEERHLREMPSAAVVSVFQTLSKVQQDVVYYAVVCDLPHKVVAEKTGLPMGTVMSNLHRGRCRLREALAQSDEFLSERR